MAFDSRGQGKHTVLIAPDLPKPVWFFACDFYFRTANFLKGEDGNLKTEKYTGYNQQYFLFR